MSLPGVEQKQTEGKPLGDGILTAREVAAYLRVTETTVCKLAAAGELPGFKIGKSWRFDRSEILERIAAAKQRGNESDGQEGRA